MRLQKRDLQDVIDCMTIRDAPRDETAQARMMQVPEILNPHYGWLIEQDRGQYVSDPLRK